MFVVYFADPVKTSLWAILAEQHAQYTWFLPQTSQRGTEFTTTKEKLTVLIYILWVKVFGNVYKTLHSEMENFDSQNQDLLKIQDLIKNELHRAPVEKDL